MGELPFRRLVQQDLPRLQERDQILSDANRNRRVAQTGKTLERLKLQTGRFLDLPLQLQAGSAALVARRHQRTKWILVLLPLMRQIERLHRPQTQWQTGGIPKRALIVAVNL